MKVLLLNLPNKDRIVRRYMCSYNAPTFLFPPQELLYCASVLKERNGCETKMVDAIAEKKTMDDCLRWLSRERPDVVVTMTGIECFESDMDALGSIKSSFPNVKTVAFGYYPTIFPTEVFGKGAADYIIKGEPETALSRLIKAMEEGASSEDISGLVYRMPDGSVGCGPAEERITALDDLPFPDPSLLAYKGYNEMLMSAPVALIQSSRGCPFRCTYCITTYGRKAVMRSPGNVVAEMKFLADRGYRRIRFTDDTFNVDSGRVRRICEGILEKGIKVGWTCLSRVDTLDVELLPLMKKAGCVRIYIGIESFSQKVLDYYQKGYKAPELLDKLKAVKDAGIESVGFILIGAPIESEEDLAANKAGLSGAPLDFAIVTKLTPYPGTVLFEKIKGMMEFSLFPYRNVFNRPGKEEEMVRIERVLYRAFYFQPKRLAFFLKTLFKNPVYAAATAVQLIRFMVTPDRTKEHPDFL